MTLERAQAALLAAIAASCFVSIFAAQLLLALACGVFAARLLKGRARVPGLALGAPLLAFSVWTLLSASFSPNPVLSHDSARKLVLFALVYLSAEGLAQPAARERVLDAMTLGGVVLAAFSLLQFYFLGFDTLDNRPRGFLGHYMTASGLQMAILVLGCARLSWTPRPFAAPARADLLRLALLAAALAALTLLERARLFPVEATRLFVAALLAAAAAMALSEGPWPSRGTSTLLCALLVPLSVWALLLSRTRNAWLGAVCGLALIALLRAPRALLPLAAGVLLVLALGPPQVTSRLTLDASSLDRYYMWQAGFDMIRDKPVFGQGPGMVLAVYPRYRWPEAPNPHAPHLHDNFLQIAAERGLPCLLFWLWLMFLLFRDAWRAARGAAQSDARLCGGAALGVLGAVMAAGTFEYNFGDSEVLMFTLLVAALPYVGAAPAAART